MQQYRIIFYYRKILHEIKLFIHLSIIGLTAYRETIFEKKII